MRTPATLAIPALALLALCHADVSHADVFRPAYLELREGEDYSLDVLWKVPARADGARLAASVRFPDDAMRLSDPRSAFVSGAHLERWRVRRDGGWIGQTVRIEGLAAGVTDVIVRVERLDGSSQTERLLPDRPFFVLTAPAGNGEIATSYLRLGFDHILGGLDHLLFVLGLMLVVRGGARLVGTVTAFTVAHSVTLAAASLGFVDVPGPPVEACIALSIVFVAAEAVHGLRGRPGLTARAPWVVAFAFGLLHGLGFAGALAEVGLPQRAIPLALLFFNLGVELGQLAFVLAMAATAAALAALRLPQRLPASAAYAPPYAIGAIATVWLIERVAAFWS